MQQQPSVRPVGAPWPRAGGTGGVHSALQQQVELLLSVGGPCPVNRFTCLFCGHSLTEAAQESVGLQFTQLPWLLCETVHCMCNRQTLKVQILPQTCMMLNPSGARWLGTLYHLCFICVTSRNSVCGLAACTMALLVSFEDSAPQICNPEP